MVLTLVQIEVFLLILARIAGLFIETPVLNAKTFPSSGKTALAIWISIIMLFFVPYSHNPVNNPVVMVFLIINEVAIGFLIGFVCQILFGAVQAAGEIVDLQMGLSIASAFDPSTGAVTSIVGKLFFYLALVMFVMLNGHHMVLSAVYQSFRVIPVGTFIHISGNLVTQLTMLVASMLLIALQLAVPALLLIFLFDFSLGIISRVAPQVNVFQLGFQMKPTIGLIAILFSTPFLITHISNMIAQMIQEIIKLLYNLI